MHLKRAITHVTPIVMALVPISIIGIWGCWFFFGQRLPDLVPSSQRREMETAGQMGDMFGGLNCLFTGLAFAAVVVSIYEERRRHKQQLEAASQELKDAQASAKAAADAREEMRHEERILRLLSIRREKYESWSVSDQDQNTYSGMQSIGHIDLRIRKVQRSMASDSHKRDAIREFVREEPTARFIAAYVRSISWLLKHAWEYNGRNRYAVLGCVFTDFSTGELNIIQASIFLDDTHFIEFVRRSGLLCLLPETLRAGFESEWGESAYKEPLVRDPAIYEFSFGEPKPHRADNPDGAR